MGTTSITTNSRGETVVPFFRVGVAAPPLADLLRLLGVGLD